jgi:CHAT domain-containing protein
VLRSRPWPCAGDRPASLPALPAARAEVQAIAQRWPAGAGPVQSLVGAEATEAAFKHEAPGRQVIHLATHGVVLEDTCAAPAGAGTRGMGGVEPVAAAPRRPARRAASTAPAPVPRLGATPWLGRQVWLALAGANRPAAEARDENEGLLTAEEIVTLDLGGTAWVVLSACHSGVAPAWAREGVLGMRRAFHLAGARAVIASQWPVADEATREWMAALYGARDRGAGAGDAVGEACRAVLAARRLDGRTTHPFYWAGFSATGR